MPPRTDYALFIDCEMTGNDQTLDEIIEIGCSLRETKTWTEVGSYTSLVQPSQVAWDRLIENETVFKMHSKNGLLSELDSAARNGIDIAEARVVDAAVEQWLDAYLKGNRTHIPLGGSGVSHFDRPYLRREFPNLDARLTFWAWDAGDLRRAFRLAARPWLREAAQADKTHRALDDARMHAEEWQYGLDAIASGFNDDFMSRYNTTYDF